MNHVENHAQQQTQNSNDDADGELQRRQEQRLYRVKLYEAILFFRDQKNDCQNNARATEKIRDVTEHGPHIRFQAQTGFTAGRAGRWPSCVVWR